MTERSELLPNLLDEDAFEVQMRGYSRRQVGEFAARTRDRIRDLEERLAQALDEREQLRRQLAVGPEHAAARPPHEEISERLAQILKLADDEAKAQKARADEDIAKIGDDAKRAAESAVGEARERADRMLKAARDQAESFASAARAGADSTREAARAEAERAATDAREEADELLASARSKAERMVAESEARSAAIDNGAARRLELLSGTYAEAARRLTEIRDVAGELLSHDSARGSLEDEVAMTVAAAMSGTPEPAHGRAQRQSADRGRAPRGKQRNFGSGAASQPAAGSEGAAGPAPSVRREDARQPAGVTQAASQAPPAPASGADARQPAGVTQAASQAPPAPASAVAPSASAGPQALPKSPGT